MMSSSAIRRLVAVCALSGLIVPFAGCGTQGNPAAVSDPVLDPLISSENRDATQGTAQGSTSLSPEVEIFIEMVQVKITPEALVLGSKGAWVTVHVDVPYDLVDTQTTIELRDAQTIDLVDAQTIELDGIDAAFSFPDDCGNLVSKFRMRDIKEIVAPPEATLTLIGYYKTGGAFGGSDTIKVKKGGAK